MPCNQKIFQAIENDCTPIKGVAPIAKWAFRSDIAFTFVDNTITAIATPTLPLGLFKSFKFGLNAGHEVKVFENYPDRFTHEFMGVSSEATDSLDAVDDIVVFVQPNGGTTWKVYGAKNGLWKTSQSFMTNDNMGIIAFEFSSRDGLEEIYECYNTSIDISALVDMDSFDLIYGGTIANGGSVKLSIDTDKTGYIKLPNGTILTTVAGVINTTYTGVAGSITYYVPKVLTTYVYAGDSGLSGNIVYNGDNQISLQTNLITSLIANDSHILYAPTNGLLESVKADNAVTITLSACVKINNLNFPLGDAIELNGDTILSNLQAPKARTIAAQDCSLTAKSIGDVLYQAYIDDRQNVIYDFSGGTNAAYGDSLTGIYKYVLDAYGINLDDLTTALAALGGTFTFNE